MNNISTIEPDAGETTTPSTALAIIPPASLPTLLAADTTDILGRLRAELNGYVPDASTERGRDEIGSKARKVGTAFRDFERLADDQKKDHQKTIKNINAELADIKTNCDMIRDAILAPRVAYLQIEKDRVAAHEAALAAIVEPFGPNDPAAALEMRLDDLNNYPARDWQEFAARAADALAREIDRTAGLLAAAQKREAEAAELARLRAEAAERDRLAAIEAQRQHEEQIAAEAAEAARIAAEAKAKREAEEQAAAVLRAQEEAERKAQAERDAAAQREREAAQLLAAAAERERVAQEAAIRANERRIAEHRAAIESLRRLAVPLELPDPLPVVDAKIGQLKDIFDNRDWEEFSDEADVMCRASGSILALARDDAIALAAKQDAARIQAQKDRDEAAHIMAEARARQELAEKQAAELAAAEKRAANRAHQAKINGEALAAIIRLMSFVHSGTADEAEKIGKAIIKAIALGEIPNTTINY